VKGNNDTGHTIVDLRWRIHCFNYVLLPHGKGVLTVKNNTALRTLKAVPPL
jgi:hypothetical protein